MRHFTAKGTKSLAMRRLRVTNDTRLLDFLLATAGAKRTAAKQWLKVGAVGVNGSAVRQFDHPLKPGDEVTIGAVQATVAAQQLQHADIRILFENDSLIAVDKPAGLLTVATDSDKADTLFMRLNSYLRGRDGSRAARAAVVHRIDQGTSGVVLFAKSPEVRDQLQSEWPTVEKLYLAIVERQPVEEQGTLISYLTESKALKVHSSLHARAGAKLATTRYRVLGTYERWSLLEVQIDTGRKHQIRVQLADLGHPVAGDRQYGAKTNPCERLALHASSLRFNDPASGIELTIRSPFPSVMARLFPASKRGT